MAAVFFTRENSGKTEKQVLNSAGCYTNQLDDYRRLRRFLIFSTETGTYRTQEQALTRDKLRSLDKYASIEPVHEKTNNLGSDQVRHKSGPVQSQEMVRRARNLGFIKLIRDGHGRDAVSLIEGISVGRRNLRHKPLIYALAMCARCDDMETKDAAYKVFPAVCRTPTHLFLFVKYCEELSMPGSGWGRAHKTAIQNWYLQFSNNPTNLLRLLMKYKRREGWTHKDVLRLAHPKPPNSAINFVLKFVISLNAEDDDDAIQELKALTQAYIDAKRCTNEGELVQLIRDLNLSWEHISTDMLNAASVWKALLKDLPIEAFLRNLIRMTRLGLFGENSEEQEIAVEKIRNTNSTIVVVEDENDYEDNNITIRQNVIHPFRIFTALQEYRRGSSSLTCIPNPRIVRELENAFYQAFQYLEPTNKKCLVAVDVSDAMSSPVVGMRDVSCAMVTAAMMMTFVRTEPNVIVGAFGTEFRTLDVTATDALEDVMRKIRECMDHGDGSNCSSPVIWSMETRNQVRDIDAFLIFTANINSCGNVHPAEAVRQYRKYSGNERVRLISCALCDNDYSIVDQHDMRMMDVVGFDLALPHAIAEFINDDD